jgi:NodT family efflux transporter outer membrane factor (OMF) lipoprotein
VRPAHPFVLLLPALLAACAVGPDYVRPTVSTPPAFKEASGWAQAQPADAAPRGDWWTLLNDPLLDQLETRAASANQNLAAAEAAYRQANALVAEQRASLFPTVDLTGQASRSSRATTSSSGSTTVNPIPGTRNSFQLGVAASWEPDLWGRVRRQIESARAGAQASAADIANVRLSIQSQLAIDYVQLRADDELKRLIDQTVEGYRRSLQVTENQYKAGAIARNDVLTAQVQLANAQAQSTDLIRQRQALEHAIAVLAGMAPAELTIAPAPWSPPVPQVPGSVPSTLLERRPDIASAERQVASANAQIGVQQAAFFPSLSLTGQYGLASSSLGQLFAASSSFWALGASAAETLLDFGARRSRVRQAEASHEQTVAQYRQTVLAAFQEVEDALSASRVLAQEAPLRAEASQAADANETIALNRYRAGMNDYTTVVVAQAAALSARQALVTNQSDRIVASLQLITALGGGWSASGSNEPVRTFSSMQR